MHGQRIHKNGRAGMIALAILVCLMLLVLFPISAYAAETEEGAATEETVLTNSGQDEKKDGAAATDGSNEVDPAADEGEGSADSAAGPEVMKRTAAEPEATEQTASDPVSYDYNAELYQPESGDYTGVYSTEALTPNEATGADIPTIGAPSIADDNLMDAPTTESPAIIQGAAVGYEEKTGPTEYTPIDGRPTPPDPYAEYRVKVMDEQAADGTTHQKLSGFDGTYVIYRLDVTNFLPAGENPATEELYLHMKQEQNKALMPAAGMTEGRYEFTDMLGNRTGSYALGDLLDGETPYLDVILYATAANVAGADAGKENVANGDVPLSLYVDSTADYNPELKYDPQSTDTNHSDNCLAKFFDTAKSAVNKVSQYLIKGSDLALETSVENSGGENGDETTYWSLKKSIEDSYYDDKAPENAECGPTVKLMSEVAVTENLTLTGTADEPKMRTLDVNSYDVQIASNTAGEGDGYSDGFTLENAWLTLMDGSNTTGAEVAVGNNARFTIDQGGKLIIDDSCQLEIEWDGATTTAAADGQAAEPAQPDTLNNGMLDLRDGGEIVNNGIITIEGTEGKPAAAGTEQQVSESEKGFGEFTINEGATLTNNGSLMVYGKLYNLGTLVNNGKYDDVIKSMDPDKGAFDYHKGIQVAWKDDVTQNNIEPGALINGKDRDGKTVAEASLVNNGDIVLTPGSLENNGVMENAEGAHIYEAVATEAIIPIEPDPATPTIVSKRITLDPVKTSSIVNNGTLINNGRIEPASVALNDNIGLGALTSPGSHPELFSMTNNGTLTNNGFIFVWDGPALVSAMSGSDLTANDTWLYLYENGSFLMVFSDGSRVTGTYSFSGDKLVFVLADGTAVEPSADADGNWVYSFTVSGKVTEFVLGAELVSSVRQQLEQNETPERIRIDAKN